MMIVKTVKNLLMNQKGQVLPLVLVMLTLGGLIIVPSINNVSANLNHTGMLVKEAKGIYAAEAGVEYAVWCTQNSISPPSQLPENINNFAVTIAVQGEGNYTVYMGQLLQTSVHYQYIDVEGSVVWDAPASAYKYTVTITWQCGEGEPRIFLEQVGARLPPGYSYQSGSVSLFSPNLSQDEPNQLVDSRGANMVNWTFNSPYPYVHSALEDRIKTQSFYITGSGELEGDYTWAAARREDVGQIGSITGGMYHITSTATQPGSGQVVKQIAADVMLTANSVEIISWQITN